MQQNLILFSKFSNLHTFIPSYKFISFWKKNPTYTIKTCRKNYFLFSTYMIIRTYMFIQNFKKISHLHSYLDSMLIRHLRVLIVWYVVLYAASMMFSLWLTGGTHPWVFNESMNEWRWTKSHHQQGGLDIDSRQNTSCIGQFWLPGWNIEFWFPCHYSYISTFVYFSFLCFHLILWFFLDNVIWRAPVVCL